MECIVDSGCTSHYIKQNSNILQHVTKKEIAVMLPNGQCMRSSKVTNLNIPNSSQIGNQAHLFQDLTSGNLLSVGQLCNDGYDVTFTKNKVTFDKNNQTMLTGKRRLHDGMWTITLPPPQKANIVIQYKPVGDAIKFLHAACFSPCVSSWCKAIDKGFFKTWPGLTSKRVRQFIKINTEATVKGHLTQERKNLRSTKTMKANAIKETLNDGIKDAYITVEAATSKMLFENKNYSDLTGKFPQRSNKGNQYIFILYDTTSNHIFAESIKDRTSTHIEKHIRKSSKSCNQKDCRQQCISSIMRRAKLMQNSSKITTKQRYNLCHQTCTEGILQRELYAPSKRTSLPASVPHTKIFH